MRMHEDCQYALRFALAQPIDQTFLGNIAGT
jgi:hypothetical protein